MGQWRPLLLYQHGDLNCSNVLVDVQNALWLIDFAKAGMHHPFVDSAKMISVLLFEHFPVPLTYEEVRAADVQRLMDFFALSAHHAEELAACVAVCATKTELVQRLVQEGVSPSLCEVLPRIGKDEATCQEFMAKAIELVDTLFAPTAREGAGEDSGGGVAAACLSCGRWRYAHHAISRCRGRRQESHTDAVVKRDADDLQMLHLGAGAGVRTGRQCSSGPRPTASRIHQTSTQRTSCCHCSCAPSARCGTCS